MSARCSMRSTARGYQEVISYAFVDPQLQGRMFPATGVHALTNPIAADLAVMRVSLWPGLLKAALDNLRRQQIAGAPVRTRRRVPAQRRGDRRIAAGRGHRGAVRALPEQWGSGREDQRISSTSRPTWPRCWSWPAPRRISSFETGRTWRACIRAAARTCMRDGAVIGWLGELHPSLARRSGPCRAVACCSNWT